MSYNDTADFRSSGFSVGTASSVALSVDFGRKHLEIQNNTSGVLYVGFDADATTSSFQIAPGVTWAPSHVPTNAIHLMAVTAGSVALIDGQP
jgi:hypothetical protein